MTVMAVFGIVGYAMKEMNYPVAPAMLGIILGDLLDNNLRRSLVLTNGSLIPFFTRPISLILFLAILLTVLGRIEPVRRLVGKAFGRSARQGG